MSKLSEETARGVQKTFPEAVLFEPNLGGKKVSRCYSSLQTKYLGRALWEEGTVCSKELRREGAWFI